MTTSVAFKEHLTGNLSKLNTNVQHNETKRKELEDALKLISPSYTVQLRSKTADSLNDSNPVIQFDDKPLPFLVRVVRHGDAYISDSDMDLLLDYPNMLVGSPSFIAGLKNFLLLALYREPIGPRCPNNKMEELIAYRASVLELMVRINADPQTAYTDMLKQRYIKNQSMISAVRGHCYTAPSDAIAHIDYVIESIQNLQTPDSLMKGVILDIPLLKQSEPVQYWSMCGEGGIDLEDHYAQK